MRSVSIVICLRKVLGVPQLAEMSKTARRGKESEGDFAMFILPSGVADRPTPARYSRPTLGDLGMVEGLPDSSFGALAPSHLEVSDLEGRDNCSCEVAMTVQSTDSRITSTLELTTDI